MRIPSDGNDKRNIREEREDPSSFPYNVLLHHHRKSLMALAHSTNAKQFLHAVRNLMLLLTPSGEL